MGVYVKGMEMPKNCFECEIRAYDANAGEEFCPFSGMGCPSIELQKNCPLVEVPEPHGKLVEFIDVTTYEDDDSGTEEVNLGEAFAAYFKMREAKPVIEAEGTNEGSN